MKVSTPSTWKGDENIIFLHHLDVYYSKYSGLCLTQAILIDSDAINHMIIYLTN